MKRLVSLSLVALFAAACSTTGKTTSEPVKADAPAKTAEQAPVKATPAPASVKATPAPVKDVAAVKKHKKKHKKKTTKATEYENCSPDALAKAREEGRQAGLKEASNATPTGTTTTK